MRYIAILVLLIMTVPAFAKTDSSRKIITPAGVKTWTVQTEASKVYDEITDEIFEDCSSVYIQNDKVPYTNADGEKEEGWFSLINMKVLSNWKSAD